jgi:methylenetetrahydrofolate dehydrogenase (NADP+) / methenyltetrahydrofolate cyclohydrolase
MAAIVLDGKRIADQIHEKTRADIEVFRTDFGVSPGLAVVIVGENPASKVYVTRKHKACKSAGILSKVVELPETVTEDDLLRQVDQLNDDRHIHGILVQLPLPKHINSNMILERICPVKDVDGFHPTNMGNLVLGKEILVPCTPYGIIQMLDMSGIGTEGKRAVIIGRSNIVGKPMALLLLARNATVTICHSRTRNLPEVTREADILIAAIGQPKFVRRDMIRPGAVVIDVGINRVGTELVGDVDFDEAMAVAGYISPVPGGVGPLTIAMLLHNTLRAARLQKAGC